METREKVYACIICMYCTINYAGGFWPGIMLTSLNNYDILMSKKFCEIVFLICYVV